LVACSVKATTKPTTTLRPLPVQLLVLMFSTLMGPVVTVALKTPMGSFSSAVAARTLCTVARNGKSGAESKKEVDLS